MKSFDSFPELAAYLMVHVAHSDGQIHFLEEATLIDNLRSFSTEAEALLKQTLEIHKSLAAEKFSDVLLANQAHLQTATVEEKQNLVRLLFSIVNSDGKVQREETQELRTIRAALE